MRRSPITRGNPLQNPPARGVFHDFVGIHVRCQAGQWPIVLKRTAEQQPLLHLRGQPYMALYDVRYS
jgi:hypothetical protein